MKASKRFTTGFLGLAAFLSAMFLAQLSWAQAPLAKAKFAFSYAFQSSDGTNASAVTYIPGPNVYVTCIAGNEDYPIEVFDGSGKTLGTLTAGLDIRGIWYNPATQRLEANAYGEGGWFSCTLDAQGVPSGEWATIRAGQHQPEEQSVLTYVPSIKKLVTITGDKSFSFWGRKNAKQKLCYQHGTPGDTDWYINPYCVGYTGNNAYPIAVLELNAGQILYFDLKGTYKGATQIDGGIPEMDGFRFAYANGFAFIYDEVDRIWRAYQTFE